MDHDTAQYVHLPARTFPDSTSWALPEGRAIGAYLNERTGGWDVLELDTDISVQHAGPFAERVIAEMAADRVRDILLETTDADA